ncbi:MAG: VanZ family protein, partial [Eubacterium sp.]
PFHAWTNFWAETSLVLSDPSTYIPAMFEQCFYEPFFNVLLLLPLGVYLRYYFKRSWFQTVIIAFLFSLSFEFIQLSALFGIYPRPYRLFQVDDLINNTLGALIGFWITPLFSFFLPSRDRLDAVAYKRGQQVTYMRRGFALLFDWGIIIGLLHLAGRIFGTPTITDMIILDGKRSVVLYIAIIVIYFILGSWITKGRTIGRFLVGIRLVSANKSPAGFFQILLRYGLEYLIIFPAPFIAVKIYEWLPQYTGMVHTTLNLIALAFGLVFAISVIQVFIGLFTRETRIFYESLSRTMDISTVGQKRRQRR